MIHAEVDLDEFVPTPDQRKVELERLERVSTTVSRWRENDPVGFNVAITVPADGAFVNTCVVPMSHDYRIDSFLLRRLEILAEVTGHRVLAVETPGVTMRISEPASTPRSKMTTRAFLRALRGDYSAVAALQIAALHDLVGVDVADCRIVGESLGAQLGSSLAAEAGGARSIDLVEPVNCRPLSIANMLKLQQALVGVETVRKADYVKRNSEQRWGNYLPFELSTYENARTDRYLKAFHRQGRFVLSAALGLRHGLYPALEMLPRGAHVRAWLASASEVSHGTDADWLARRLSHAGVYLETTSMHATTIWPQGIGHHALTDFDMMFAFSRVLGRVWKTEASPKP